MCSAGLFNLLSSVLLSARGRTKCFSSSLLLSFNKQWVSSGYSVRSLINNDKQKHPGHPRHTILCQVKFLGYWGWVTMRACNWEARWGHYEDRTQGMKTCSLIGCWKGDRRVWIGDVKVWVVCSQPAWEAAGGRVQMVKGNTFGMRSGHKHLLFSVLKLQSPMLVGQRQTQLPHWSPCSLL